MPDFTYATGWIPDPPDARDYHREHPTIAPLLAGTRAGRDEPLPSIVDLREGASPIEDQGRAGSCTAQAAVGLVEWMERRAHGRHVDGSRLFVYKVTRDFLGLHGDSGATLRGTAEALVQYGLPPEALWPYELNRLDDAPPPEVYTEALRWRSLRYWKLDLPSAVPEKVLVEIKRALASALPVMFGFTAYESIADVGSNGLIPWPAWYENPIGGHAVCTVGFDDGLGALLIRNSWGVSWGDAGYGWLLYRNILERRARDVWGLLEAAWVETGRFT